MRQDIDAAAFDLDGTLYPNYRLYIRLVPFAIREYRLLSALGRAREALRAGDAASAGPGAGPHVWPKGAFYQAQARVMAGMLGEDPAAVEARIEALIYRGWEPLFREIRLFPHVRETLAALRGAGLKTGLLSDFPPAAKLERLGLGGLWDAVLCSEEVGRLKPDPAPFAALADALGTEPGRIIYVGNSLRYDIRGARRSGLRAALIHPFPPLAPKGEADFVFSSYRQLRRYLLGGGGENY